MKSAIRFMDSSSLLGKYIIEKKKKNRKIYTFLSKGKKKHANIGGAKEWGEGQSKNSGCSH